MVAPAPAVGKDELLSAIEKVLEASGGEADAGTIRASLAKMGMISVTRSDVNKVLYANSNLFEVARQENLKPIWKKR